MDVNQTLDDRIRSPFRILALFSAVTLVLVALLPGSAAADKIPPVQRYQEAVDKFKPILGRLVRASPKDRDAKKTLKSTFDEMVELAEPLRAPVLGSTRWAKGAYSEFIKLFNRAVLLHGFFDTKCKEDFICWQLEVGYRRMVMLIPAEMGWGWKWSKEEQLSVTMTCRNRHRRMISEIEIWYYRWDTLYSGVGGENAKKLAERIRDIDVSKAKEKGGKVSRIKIQRLSRDISRAYVYTIRDAKRTSDCSLIKREIYVKGRTATFNIATREAVKAHDSESKFDAWRRSSGDADLDFMLSSLRFKEDD